MTTSSDWRPICMASTGLGSRNRASITETKTTPTAVRVPGPTAWTTISATRIPNVQPTATSMTLRIRGSLVNPSAMRAATAAKIGAWWPSSCSAMR